jgi:hypothetical protein
MPLIETVATNVTSIASLSPLLLPIQRFFKVTSALIGGLFGLYFIFFFIRIFYQRKILKEVQLLKSSVHRLQSQFDNMQKKRRKKK